ncbi:hypothetical protein M1M38_gp090 [Halorubrum tailed virus 27]|uniref:Uncharacterized protein n=1 Tax=Halorubrum tailed virus 27 TaxID=2878008 RepID=A0AAE8Y184_9CAUD|nr:hypothetical protein M1M38_gp090 [Halorubrum tailed virus 27]UBF22783.1 hypothetical protein HRTV-27_gp90 [Halorubrum tailed virus 27]
MTYTQDEIEEFRARWHEYIGGFERLKLAVPAEKMADVTEAQEQLRHAVEDACESFEDEL